MLPGTALVELAIAGCQLARGEETLRVSASFQQVLPVSKTAPPEVWLRLRPHPEGGLTWRVVSSAAPWRVHAEGRAQSAATGTASAGLAALPASDATADVRAVTSADQLAAASQGTGPRWRCVRAVTGGQRAIVLALRLPPEFAGDLAAHYAHPALLDAVIRAAAAAWAGDGYLPVACGSLVSHRSLPADAEATVIHRKAEDAGSRSPTLVIDIEIRTPGGEPVLGIERLVLRPASLALAAQGRASDDSGLTTADALAALDTILGNRHLPHVLVSSRAASSGPPSWSRGMSATDTHRTPEDPRLLLTQVLERHLGVTGIAPDHSIFELGADSLLIVQIAAELQQAGLGVSPADLFIYPTIEQMLAHLGEQSDRGFAAPGTLASPSDTTGDDRRFPQAELSTSEITSVLAMLESSGDD